jgi:hypothetical protein
MDLFTTTNNPDIIEFYISDNKLTISKNSIKSGSSIIDKTNIGKYKSGDTDLRTAIQIQKDSIFSLIYNFGHISNEAGKYLIGKNNPFFLRDRNTDILLFVEYIIRSEAQLSKFLSIADISIFNSFDEMLKHYLSRKWTQLQRNIIRAFLEPELSIGIYADLSRPYENGVFGRTSDIDSYYLMPSILNEKSKLHTLISKDIRETEDINLIPNNIFEETKTYYEYILRFIKLQYIWRIHMYEKYTCVDLGIINDYVPLHETNNYNRIVLYIMVCMIKNKVTYSDTDDYNIFSGNETCQHFFTQKDRLCITPYGNIVSNRFNLYYNQTDQSETYIKCMNYTQIIMYQNDISIFISLPPKFARIDINKINQYCSGAYIATNLIDYNVSGTLKSLGDEFTDEYNSKFVNLFRMFLDYSMLSEHSDFVVDLSDEFDKKTFYKGVFKEKNPKQYIFSGKPTLYNGELYVYVAEIIDSKNIGTISEIIKVPDENHRTVLVDAIYLYYFLFYL